jgi:hypothetical protein
MGAFITPIDNTDPTAGYGKQGKLGNYGDAGVAPAAPNNATGGAAGVISRPSAQQLGTEYPHDPVWQQRGQHPTVDQQGAAHILEALSKQLNPAPHADPHFYLEAALHNGGGHSQFHDILQDQKEILRHDPEEERIMSEYAKAEEGKAEIAPRDLFNIPENWNNPEWVPSTFDDLWFSPDRIDNRLPDLLDPNLY